MKSSQWVKIVLGITIGLLFGLAAVTAWIDPFLHYHEPIGNLQYPLKDERYQNDGMLRHYSYDAVITGTSMCQNFKPSEFDALWGTNSLKVCYSGASFKEVDESIRRALEYRGDLKYVLRSLDSNLINRSAQEYTYEEYPAYLYDHNPFNDVKYLLNKEVVPKTLAVINYTRSGQKTVNRDAYGSWSGYKQYGKEEVFKTWSPFEEAKEDVELNREDYDRIRENVEKNILQTALDNPQVTFYLFIPPYSICYWNTLVRTRQLDAALETERYAVELLLQADNIHVYGFSDHVDLVEDLDHYTDALHYGEWINSRILVWIQSGEGELTRENYQDYFQRLGKIYEAYDYSALVDTL